MGKRTFSKSGEAAATVAEIALDFGSFKKKKHIGMSKREKVYIKKGIRQWSVAKNPPKLKKSTPAIPMKADW